LNLKAQQIQLLRVSLFIHDERRFLIFQNRTPPHQFTERLALALQFTERIQNQKLLGRIEQRLMVVRAVHVHQPFADGREHAQRRRGAVDELPVGAVRSESALKDELIIVARFNSILFEKKFQKRTPLIFSLSSTRRGLG